MVKRGERVAQTQRRDVAVRRHALQQGTRLSLRSQPLVGYTRVPRLHGHAVVDMTSCVGLN
jgi:hypothetical protein